MAPQSVLLAPVAAETLASAAIRPNLLREVAFGTRQRDLDAAPGTPVFIYASAELSPHHPFFREGVATWTGTLGSIVPAVASGARRGMHPDPHVRPPFAERYDYRDAALFWHVHDLAPLMQPIALDRFRDPDGSRLYGGLLPLWIAKAVLRQDDAEPIEPLLRAA